MALSILLCLNSMTDDVLAQMIFLRNMHNINANIYSNRIAMFRVNVHETVHESSGIGLSACKQTQCYMCCACVAGRD